MSIEYFLELLGTGVFAFSGVISAERKNLDLTAVVLVAFVVGNGGGTLRDIVMGATPVFWLIDTNYILVTVTAAVLGIILLHYIRVPRRIFLLVDALGLGLFAVVGTEKALYFGFSAPTAVMMGMLTASGGGLFRDILCNDVPLIMRGDIYATAALLGAILYVILAQYPLSKVVVSICAVAFIFFIRLIAIFVGLRMPIFRGTR